MLAGERNALMHEIDAARAAQAAPREEGDAVGSPTEA
jgi:hypothetical protein